MESKMELLNQFKVMIERLKYSNYSRAELLQVIDQQIDIMEGDLFIESIKQQMSKQEQATV